MFKKIAYAGLIAGTAALVSSTGCTTSSTANGNKDFAVVGDGGNTGGDGGAGDMSVIKAYQAATPNQVDTNQIGGTFNKGTAVSMTGLIVLGPPTSFASKITVSKDGCKYQVWAQDPTCTTPPCGILLVTPAIINPAGVGMFCPFAKDTSTALKNVWKGDKLDVQGVVDTFASSATAPATGTVVQHEISLDSVTQVSMNQTLPAPMVVTDTDPSKFTPYSGAGWAMYEGTYIKLQRSSGKFTTTLDSFGGWTTAPGGGHFADTFTSFFRPDGGAANLWPPTGSMYGSIAGIVSMTFGGGILPTDNADFVP